MGDKVEVSLTKRMYGWSKYGGGRKGIVQENLDEWSCNLCGKRMVKPMTVYFIPFTDEEREFFKLCGSCKHQAIKQRINTFQDMMAAKVENLITVSGKY